MLVSALSSKNRYIYSEHKVAFYYVPLVIASIRQAALADTRRTGISIIGFVIVTTNGWSCIN